MRWTYRTLHQPDHSTTKHTRMTPNSTTTATHSSWRVLSHSLQQAQFLYLKMWWGKGGRGAALPQVREITMSYNLHAYLGQSKNKFLRETIQILVWDVNVSISTTWSESQHFSKQGKGLEQTLRRCLPASHLNWIHGSSADKRWQERKRKVFSRELTATDRARSWAETWDSQ